MFRVIFLGFLVFTMSCVLIPTATYAMSLDDDEEDREDAEDYLAEAKKASASESFDTADALLGKAKQLGVLGDDVAEVGKYVAGKKQAKAERLERERKERERLARFKREKEERARQARLARQRQQSQSYGSSSGGTIGLCVPSIPYKCCKDYECRAKTASGRYENATVKLEKDFVGSCYTLSVYGGNGYGGGSTCSGANGGWSVSANGKSGYANGLAEAVAWILRRM